MAQTPGPEPELEGIAAGLEGNSADRAAAYLLLERAAEAGAVELVAACVKPLSSVLCAPASRIAAPEWQRASLLLYELVKVDLVKVGVELLRKDAAIVASAGAVPEGGFGPPAAPLGLIWSAPDSALGEMVRKEPST